MKKYGRLFLDNAMNMFCMSVLTGLFAGVIVTFYNILMSIGEGTSEQLYALLSVNPAFIPLLFAGLAAGAVLIGTLVRFVPMIRGSGIPQIEGAARGVIRFKWYVFFCFFLCYFFFIHNSSLHYNICFFRKILCFLDFSNNLLLLIHYPFAILLAFFSFN